MAKVLLIEDDDEFRDYVASGLRRLGHAVTIAPASMVVTSQNRKVDFSTAFDVIVTDILMPDVDGLEVIRQLKATNPACRIIAMSGGGRLNGSDIYLHLADVFGVDATLAKPFDIPELCNAMIGKTAPGSGRTPPPPSGPPPQAGPNAPSTPA